MWLKSGGAGRRQSIATHPTVMGVCKALGAACSRQQMVPGIYKWPRRASCSLLFVSSENKEESPRSDHQTAHLPDSPREAAPRFGAFCAPSPLGATSPSPALMCPVKYLVGRSFLACSAKVITRWAQLSPAMTAAVVESEVSQGPSPAAPCDPQTQRRGLSPQPPHRPRSPQGLRFCTEILACLCSCLYFWGKTLQAAVPASSPCLGSEQRAFPWGL